MKVMANLEIGRLRKNPRRVGKESSHKKRLRCRPQGGLGQNADRNAPRNLDALVTRPKHSMPGKISEEERRCTGNLKNTEQNSSKGGEGYEIATEQNRKVC